MLIFCTQVLLNVFIHTYSILFLLGVKIASLYRGKCLIATQYRISISMLLGKPAAAYLP